MSAFKAKCTIFSLIILLAGLAAIGSFFMAWYTAASISVTGLDFMTKTTVAGSQYMNWMPALAMMSGVSVAIAGLISLVRPHSGVSWSVILSGLIIVGAALLFYTYSYDGYFSWKMSDYAGTGVFVAIGAGIVVIIFALLRITSKDKKCS
ncbi:MAG: hypothetical protein FWC44_01930 [Methanomassiliicoccaceae archaeon]|nr:hypothetical protein [Methanomassiliicoccaceae archaeon]MCL2317804.1 hypothetical protein [Methanomassiliicoccaceae archaeon]